MDKLTDTYMEKVKSGIINHYDIRPSIAQEIYDNMIKECEKISSQHQYYTTFYLTKPVQYFSLAKSYLERYNMEYGLDLEFPESDEYKALNGKISSMKWILKEESFGFIRVISKEKLSKNDLDLLSRYVISQHDGDWGRTFESRKFGAKFEYSDYEFKEYPTNDKLKDAIESIREYCAYTTCSECIFKKRQLELDLPFDKSKCPMVCTIINMEIDE